MIATDGSACDEVLTSLTAGGISASCIGDLTSGDPAAIIDRSGQQALPSFERDELARYLEALDEGAEPR